MSEEILSNLKNIKKEVKESASLSKKEIKNLSPIAQEVLTFSKQRLQTFSKLRKLSGQAQAIIFNMLPNKKQTDKFFSQLSPLAQAGVFYMMPSEERTIDTLVDILSPEAQKIAYKYLLDEDKFDVDANEGKAFIDALKQQLPDEQIEHYRQTYKKALSLELSNRQANPPFFSEQIKELWECFHNVTPEERQSMEKRIDIAIATANKQNKEEKQSIEKQTPSID